MHKHKEYHLPFKLDESKLTALVDAIHSRLDDHLHAVLPDQFEVYFSEVEYDALSNLEAVLALANSQKRPITRILMVCSAATPHARIPEREVQIDFGVLTMNPSGSKSKAVAINIRSADDAWASHAMSAVEQQVERTWQHHTQPILWLVAIILALAFISLSQVGGPRRNSNYDSGMWLRGPDVERIQEMLKADRVLTEDESREVLTLQLRNVAREQSPSVANSKELTRPFLLLAAATVLVLGCAAVLLFTGYPATVFYWGDGIERYDRILTRRKVLWSVVTGITVIALFGTMFAEGMISILVPK